MRRFITLGSALALLLLASAALAASSKLDPHARAALAQLRAGASVQTLRANRMSVSDVGDLNVFITGSVSRADLEAMGVTVRTFLPGVCTAYVPAGVIDQLALRTDVSQIRAAVLCEQSNNISIPLTGAGALRGAGPAFAGFNGAGVLVGDVDSGIDIHHGDFQDPAGLSRILYLWDQNNTASVVPPSGFAIGHEWLKSDIDGGLCTETDGATNVGHGSHVMGIIAGDGSKSTTSPYLYAGMAPKADIAMVATTFYDTDILDGVNYIFQKATALGVNSVVNLSLGSQYGPHDGSSPLETGLDALSGPGRVICVAAGNDASTTTFIHGGMVVPAAGDSMKFNISAGGTTSGRGVEFNGWYNAPDNMTVKLRSPGNLIITLAPGTSYGVQSPATGWPTNNTGVNGRVYIENGISTSSNGAREIYLILQASGTGTGGITGVWTVYCTPTYQAGSTTRVDMYKDYVSTTSLVVNFSLKNANDHLVSETACARNVVTVGAFQSRYNWVSCTGSTYNYTGTTAVGTGAICSFSNIGPTRDGISKPEIVAPGSAIISTLSADYSTICGSGNVADGPAHQVMAGTSMAAPHVAGAVALLFQKYGTLTPAQVKTYLVANAKVDSYTGAPWNATYGNGKLYMGDLINPAVSVTYPNGGEVLYIGAPTLLTWYASDNIGVTSVDVNLSRNGVGGPWETIATAVPNTGSYSWTVSGPITTTAYLRVVAHDAGGNTATDLSDAEFQIADAATSTLLSTFVANSTPQGIELHWQLANPGSFSSISVERATSGAGPWDVLGAPIANADGFTLVDNGVVDGQSYLYRLQGVNTRGTVTTLGQITGTAGQAITEFAISRIAPNPSRGQTTVEFTVPRSANVKVAVLDVQGREVVTLANGQHAPGRYQLSWSGEAHGRRAASGLYFVRIQAPGVQLTRRVIISR